MRTTCASNKDVRSGDDIRSGASKLDPRFISPNYETYLQAGDIKFSLPNKAGDALGDSAPQFLDRSAATRTRCAVKHRRCLGAAKFHFKKGAIDARFAIAFEKCLSVHAEVDFAQLHD